MKGITRDCAQEMVDRKSIWIYAVITVIALLIIMGLRSVRIMEGGPGMDSSTSVLAEMGQSVTISGLDTFLSLLVFITVFVTAGLLPGMLIRGRAEFYLSKPLSRTSLLINKLVGIWVVYGAVIVAAGILAWGMFYVTFGTAVPQAFWLFLFNLLALFVWLSIVIFAGVFSGSAAMSIVTAFLIWVVQGLLASRGALEALIDSKFILKLVDALYYVLPKTSEMANIGEALAKGNTVETWLPLWTTLLFALALLTGTVYIFKSKDY